MGSGIGRWEVDDGGLSSLRDSWERKKSAPSHGPGAGRWKKAGRVGVPFGRVRMSAPAGGRANSGQLLRAAVWRTSSRPPRPPPIKSAFPSGPATPPPEELTKTTPPPPHDSCDANYGLLDADYALQM